MPFTVEIKNAVKTDNVGSLEDLISRGAVLDNTDKYNWLYLAAKNNSTDVLRFLLKNGAPIDAKDPNTGDTALQAAVIQGHLQAVVILLAHHADTHVVHTTGETLMHDAVHIDNTEIIDALATVNPQLLNQENNEGITPLTYAISLYFAATPLAPVYKLAAMQLIALGAQTNADVFTTFMQRAQHDDRPSPSMLKYDAHTAGLAQGPRMKSNATIEFEKIIRELLNPKAVIHCQYNVLNELLLNINGIGYNLTTLLQHQPDFEQLAFTPEEIAQYANFIIDPTLSHQFSIDLFDKNDTPTVPTEQDYANVDPQGKQSHLLYGEKLAITWYTQDPNYYFLNQFLRAYGAPYEPLPTNSLDKSVKEMLLAAAMASHGLAKPVSAAMLANQPKMQTLVRGEQPVAAIQQQRQQDSLGRKPTTQLGFTSTSLTGKSAKYHKPNRYPIQIKIKQPVTPNPLGKEIEELSTFGSHANVAEGHAEKEILFTPGTQFIYKPSANSRYFSATPVRTIDMVDPFSYSASHAHLRDQLIKILAIAQSITNSSPGLIQIITNLHATIFALNLPKNDQEKLAMLKNLKSELTQHASNLTSLARTYSFEYAASIAKMNLEMREIIVKFSTIFQETSLLKAAEYAYTHYFNKPYADIKICDEDAAVVLRDVTIERPNHGLAHSVRVAVFVPAVVDYFKNFAADAEFKQFCAMLKPKEVAYLQLALLFSVAGRQSEVTFSDNRAKYDEYKQKSAEAFKDYAQTIGMPPNDITQYMEIINPGAVQTISSPEKSYLIHLFTLSHRFDLARCYSADEMTNAIQLSNQNTIHASVTQAAALDRLCHLAQNTILATGDRLLAAYKDNSFMDAEVPYHPVKFSLCSMSPQECIFACMDSLQTSMPEIYLKAALSAAVKENDIETVIKLLTSKVDVNQLDSDGYAPLHLAIIADLDDMASLLLEYGADINLSTQHGDTPLHLAAGLADRQHFLEGLLTIEGIAIDKLNASGETPLEVARSANNMQAITALSPSSEYEADEENKSGLQSFGLFSHSQKDQPTIPPPKPEKP
jgi:ankyrin repeat protein